MCLQREPVFTENELFSDRASKEEHDAWGARTMEEFITEQVESFSGALLRADDSLF